MGSGHIPEEINKALDRLPPDLLGRSGSVFYTGKRAFQSAQPLYLLGLNPGGNPVAQRNNTVARHIREFRDRDDPWSAYSDDSWEGALGIRTVVCFGGTAGRWVRERLGADERFDVFREANARGWQSEAHRSENGKVVVTVTHPGRADWRNPAADPTDLVRRAIDTEFS